MTIWPAKELSSVAFSSPSPPILGLWHCLRPTIGLTAASTQVTGPSGGGVFSAFLSLVGSPEDNYGFGYSFFLVPDWTRTSTWRRLSLSSSHLGGRACSRLVQCSSSSITSGVGIVFVFSTRLDGSVDIHSPVALGSECQGTAIFCILCAWTWRPQWQCTAWLHLSGNYARNSGEGDKRPL